MKWKRVFLSLVLILVFMILFSCNRTPLVSIPEWVPVLIKEKDTTGNQIWYKVHYDIAHGKIIEESKESIFIDRSVQGIQKIEWDGGNQIYHAKLDYAETLIPFEDANANIIRHPSRASFLFKFQGIEDNRQVLVYLPKSAEERDHAFVEIYGRKPQKITLTPSFEDISLIRLMRPIGIQQDDQDLVFYFHAAKTRPQGTQFLIIEAKFDGNAIHWRIVTDQLNAQSIGTNVIMEHYHQYIYIINNEGIVHRTNTKNGKTEKDEYLSSLIQQFMHSAGNQENMMHMADIYTYQSLMIIKWNSFMPSESSAIDEMDSSYALAIIVHGNEVVKKMTHKDQPGLFDWIFPRQLFRN